MSNAEFSQGEYLYNAKYLLYFLIYFNRNLVLNPN